MGAQGAKREDEMGSAQKAELYPRVEDVLTRTIEEKQHGAGAQGQATSPGLGGGGPILRVAALPSEHGAVGGPLQPSCCSGPHAFGCSSSTRVLRELPGADGSRWEEQSLITVTLS